MNTTNDNIVRIEAEIDRLIAETARINAKQEGPWLPIVAMATAIGIAVVLATWLS
ncbi:MAG: hypothetical protein Q4A98_10040 [Comamonadaceae bacterium]|nr:hypothetical protein [Comamonadaceae bacterium]